MNTVLIPAWRRPEFLWHCLANIKRANGADQYHYIFRFDHGHSPENHEVIKGFPFSHEVAETRRTPYQLAKQSYSLLTGYAYAASKTDRLVYMIEEDVMIAADFFQFHEEIHNQNIEVFCSIAAANPNKTIVDTGTSTEYYLSTNDYCSLGVCFNMDMLIHEVLSKVRSSYYVNPVHYCATQFKGLPFGQGFAEQDGLIRRIQYLAGMDRPIAWPWQARAYHAGLYGENRGAGPSGTIEQRIAYLGDVIYSDAAMRTLAKHPEWYEDSRPINLNPEPWTNLQLKHLNPERNPDRF